MAELSHEDAWRACNQVVRLWVTSVASQFGADPARTWTGERIERFLNDILDQTDVTFDHFEFPPERPEAEA